MTRAGLFSVPLKQFGALLYWTALFEVPVSRATAGRYPRILPHFVPVIFAFQGPSELIVVVDDSREGWRDALKALLEAYFYGHKAPVLDVSQLRYGSVWWFFSPSTHCVVMAH